MHRKVAHFILLPLVSTTAFVSTAKLTTMPPNQSFLNLLELEEMALRSDEKIHVAVLGCGMMGQEHISYISGYDDLQIDYLCDPHQRSLDKSLGVLKEFSKNIGTSKLPTLLQDEKDLLTHASDIDLLVIASPNYLHTQSLQRWGKHPLTILVEKPVAVSREQVEELKNLQASPDFVARVWVAMEYRYIPAIAKLLSLLPRIGDLRMVTIRENRFPFLHKVGAWNRDRSKTGDSLVEKCCHFFDLFRLITQQETNGQVQAMAQRGINYQHEAQQMDPPVLDSAYVILGLQDEKGGRPPAMGSLELCMFAEGSRHQEEIIVTGTMGRLEAYLPENKVYYYERPNHNEWVDRSMPPPKSSIHEEVFDCSDVKDVHGITANMPTHGGHHYCSTAVEWFHLIGSIRHYKERNEWIPQVSLTDGIRAVELGIAATESLTQSTRVTLHENHPIKEQVKTSTEMTDGISTAGE